MNTIKKIRLALDMTQEGFGKLLGVTQAAIGNYESNIRSPKLNICYKIIKLAAQHNIKVELSELLPSC